MTRMKFQLETETRSGNNSRFSFGGSFLLVDREKETHRVLLYTVIMPQLQRSQSLRKSYSFRGGVRTKLSLLNTNSTGDLLGIAPFPFRNGAE
jgi:hypothetical protein